MVRRNPQYRAERLCLRAAGIAPRVAMERRLERVTRNVSHVPCCPEVTPPQTTPEPSAMMQPLVAVVGPGDHVVPVQWLITFWPALSDILFALAVSGKKVIVPTARTMASGCLTFKAPPIKANPVESFGCFTMDLPPMAWLNDCSIVGPLASLEGALLFVAHDGRVPL